MPLPEQLADVARELARRGLQTSDAPTYTAGVRDTLTLVGELLRLSATGLPRTGQYVMGPARNTAEHLRRLAYELDRLIGADSSLETRPALSPRVRFDLSRAQELLAGAAAELDASPGLVTVATTDGGDSGTDGDGPGGRGTWLAAFALAIAREPGADDRDVRDIVRLSGNDPDVLAAAARRVEAAGDVEPEHRRRARLLFARADALATGPQRTGTH